MHNSRNIDQPQTHSTTNAGMQNKNHNYYYNISTTTNSISKNLDTLKRRLNRLEINVYKCLRLLTSCLTGKMVDMADAQKISPVVSHCEDAKLAVSSKPAPNPLLSAGSGIGSLRFDVDPFAAKIPSTPKIMPDDELLNPFFTTVEKFFGKVEFENGVVDQFIKESNDQQIISWYGLGMCFECKI